MARTITQSVNRSLSSLSHEKRLALIEELRELCFEHECAALTEQAQENAQEKMVFCSNCGSIHVSKYGKRNGKQRYRCVDCGKSFTDTGNRSMISSSKLSRSTWMKFIEAYVDNLSVKKCALKCGVSVRTAYSMRLRIMELIANSQEEWLLKEDQTAQLDECFVYESFKGNRTKCQDFVMPRPAFKRGRAKDKSYQMNLGRSKADHICIASGVCNDNRKAFFSLAGRAIFTTQEATRILGPKIKQGSKVITDELNAYKGVLNDLGAHHVSFNSKTTDGKLNEVNALHSHFKSYLRAKKGVSTRRLPLYFADFTWRWENGIETAQTKYVVQDLVRQIAVTDFTTVLPVYQTTDYPYFDWWNTEEGQKESARIKLFRMQYGINKERIESIGDEAKEKAVAERQARLDQKAAEADIDLTTNTERRATYVKPKSTPQLTFSMLKSKRE